MRPIIAAALAASALSLFVKPVSAQISAARRSLLPSRFSIGGDVVMAQPKRDFADNISRGWGGDLSATYALDKEGYFQLRADGGLVQYGNETKRIPLNPITGRVSLKVVTSNMIGWGSFAGQMQIPEGPIRPYVNGGLAYTRFAT